MIISLSLTPWVPICKLWVCTGVPIWADFGGFVIWFWMDMVCGGPMVVGICLMVFCGGSVVVDGGWV